MDHKTHFLQTNIYNQNLAGQNWGPHQPKLRFMVGETKTTRQNWVEIEATLAQTKAEQILVLYIKQ